MNDLQIFNYGEHAVRTVEIDGEPWFVLKDVCDVIGITNHKNVSARIEQDEKDEVRVADPLGREQQTTIINEPGLYNVILRSDKPEARDFKRWITHEVLPAIRKTGGYAVQPRSAAEMFALQAQVNLEYERRLAALESSEQATQEKVIGMARLMQSSIVPAESWQDAANAIINELVEANGLNHQRYRQYLYESLERSARVDLQARQTRLRNRMAKEGKTKTQQREVSKLYIIAQDQKLRSIFDSILREERAKVLCPA